MLSLVDVAEFVIPRIDTCKDRQPLASVSKTLGACVAQSGLRDQEVVRQIARAFDTSISHLKDEIATQAKHACGASARGDLTFADCGLLVRSIVKRADRVEFPCQCWLCGDACGMTHPLYGFGTHARCVTLSRLKASKAGAGQTPRHSEIPWTLEVRTRGRVRAARPRDSKCLTILTPAQAWDARELGPERQILRQYATSNPFPHTDDVHARVRALHRDPFFRLVMMSRLRDDHRTHAQRELLRSNLKGHEV